MSVRGALLMPVMLGLLTRVLERNTRLVYFDWEIDIINVTNDTLYICEEERMHIRSMC